MNKICTSLEQSKKLLNLGIDINTADLIVTNYPLQDGSRFDFICCKLPNDTFPSITDGKSEKIPAWSLSALLELMPERIKIGEDLSFCLTSKKSSTGFSFGYNLNGSTFVKDNPIDAAFEMICWLKENGKI